MKRGIWPERLAALWLQLHGWVIVERRLTGRRGSGIGEVDLVARRFGVLAFVEIKYRPSPDQAAAAISTNQKRRIIRAAKAYLAGHPELAGSTVRFDAIFMAPWSRPHHVQAAWDEEA